MREIFGKMWDVETVDLGMCACDLCIRLEECDRNDDDAFVCHEELGDLTFLVSEVQQG